MKENVMIADLFLIENRKLGMVSKDFIDCIDVSKWDIEDNESCFNLVIYDEYGKKIKLNGINTLIDFNYCIILVTNKGNIVLTVL